MKTAVSAILFCLPLLLRVVIIALPREAIVTMDVRSFPTIIVPKISSWSSSSSTSCRRWTMIICRNGMVDARVKMIPTTRSHPLFIIWGLCQELR